MSRRLLSRFFASCGAVALVAAPSAGVAHAVEEPPAPAAITVELDPLTGPNITGTVSCEPGTRVDLRGSVSQDAYYGPDDVLYVYTDGSGRVRSLACGSGPTPFSLPLWGNNVLVPGTVSYGVVANQVWPEGEPGVPAPEGSAHSELTLDRRIDLRAASGRIPVTISPVAGVADTGPVATGTMTCVVPVLVKVAVTGYQEGARFTGEGDMPCEGVTPFAVRFTSPDAQLLPGPADVTVRVQALYHVAVGSGTGHAVVELRNATPEPDFAPPREPEDVVDWGAFRRVDGRLVVGLGLPACDAPATVFWHLEAYPRHAVVDGRWYRPSLFGDFIEGEVVCDGTEPRVTATFSDAVGTGDVIVEMEFTEGGPGAVRHRAAVVASPK